MINHVSSPLHPSLDVSLFRPHCVCYPFPSVIGHDGGLQEAEDPSEGPADAILQSPHHSTSSSHQVGTVSSDTFAGETGLSMARKILPESLGSWLHC